MEGKIVVYSEETGLGKIITPQKRKYNFSVDEWDDYDVMPAVGLIVHFEPDGFHAQKVRPFSQQAPQNAASPATPRSNSQPRPAAPHEAAPSDEHDPRESFEPEIDIETTIQLHFHDIIKAVEAAGSLLNETRRLDFLKMRRFLMTAYNNLVEIDHGFENFELTQLRQQLLEAYETYRSFTKKSAYLSRAYEQVFLNKQRRYRDLRAKIELNKTQIAALNDAVKRREEEIAEKEARLKNLDPHADEALYLANELKLLKRSLVDAIHEIGKLTEENRLYTRLLDNFYKAHYDRFKKIFGDFTAKYEAQLRKIMDVLAYKFDTKMWQKANRSKAIQHFFLEAGITDEFSSITYLKYYIKTLDTSKLNEENQQLLELLRYLEEQKRYRVICLDDDPEFLTLVREAIHQVDPDIKVTLASRIEQITGELKHQRPHIVMLNPDMAGLDLEATLAYLRKQAPEAEVAFFASRINRSLLLAAKNANAAAIIPKTRRQEELYQQFVQYFK